MPVHAHSPQPPPGKWQGERLFRCAGDIHFLDPSPVPDQPQHVTLKPFSETVNYVQYQRPLTPQQPAFFIQVLSLGVGSVVTVGIAGPSIADDVHPGSWNGTVGYRSSGQCYTAHRNHTAAATHTYGQGDVFGVMVTYFGKDKSTVIFLKNNKPVATRYIFEPDHNHYLPTIALEKGPIEVILHCPPAVTSLPHYLGRSLEDWICSPGVCLNNKRKLFYTNDKSTHEHLIQSPVPLSRTIQHYEVIVEEVSDMGAAPTIAIATCSPLVPPPTCVLLNDYFRWHPDGKLLRMRRGQRMGWGIQYNPASRDSPQFDERAEQLVLCYVTIDVTIVYAKMMLQPAGGWYPVVMLHPYASQVRVDMETNAQPVINERLDELFHNLLPEAVELVNQDHRARALSKKSFRHSPELVVDAGSTGSTVTLPRDRKGIHVLQFLQPLTPDQRYFSVEVTECGDNSMVCVGVAGREFPLNRYPGRLKDTIGYHSRDGKMFYNDKDNGNMRGQRYGKGDTVGLELEVFSRTMSVALFSRNGLPVGTRYVTQSDHSQLLPTVALASSGGGGDISLRITWQNRVSAPPAFNVTCLEHWCLPEGATVDVSNSIISVDPAHHEAEAVQAPYSLHRTYNHFEVELIDDFDENNPPPAIALCTASPFDPTPKTNFKQDFIRFWATGEAQKAVRKGDLMGWGMVYPEEGEEGAGEEEEEEQLVVCYLTINRDVALTRVMYQPPGGFYPVVLMPPGVDRIKLNFGATIITEHPFTRGALQQLVAEARAMIRSEQRSLAAGHEPEDWDAAENKAKYLRPVPKTLGQEGVEERAGGLGKEGKEGEEMLPGLKRRETKMANLVEAMMLESVSSPTGEDAITDPSSGPSVTPSSPTHPNGKAHGQSVMKGSVETSRTCEIL